MRERLTLITEPSFEPITLADAKDHLRIEDTLDDDYIAALIRAAREHAERYLWRGIATQTWELILPCFPDCEISLPMGNLRSVTSVKYIDTAGNEQTLDAAVYDVDDSGGPGRVLLAYGQVWPCTYPRWDAVRIRYTVGWEARRVFEASATYRLGEYVVPTQGNENGHYYKVTTAGTSAATEPTWPTTDGGTVTSGTVTFTAQGARIIADEVPVPIVQAMKLLISQMYEHRTPEVVGATIAQVNFAVDALLRPYRLAGY